MTRSVLFRITVSYGHDITMQTLTALSIKVPSDLKRRLEEAARLEGRTLSSFTRFHLENYLTPAAPTPKQKRKKEVRGA